MIHADRPRPRLTTMSSRTFLTGAGVPSACAAGGRDLDHRRAVEEERGVSEYAFDYCFPGDELGFKLVVLSGREKVTGMYFAAAAVPTKGSLGRFAVDKAVDYIRELGDQEGRILVKTDQEPAIKTWANDLIAARPEGRTIAEESPVQSSGSNGRAERAVQALEGQIRILLLSLENRLGVSIDAREPLVTYIPEYAAYLLNRLEVGKDGKTAYERCKGKKAKVLGLHFGEKVLYKMDGDRQDVQDPASLAVRHLRRGKASQQRGMDRDGGQDLGGPISTTTTSRTALGI